MRDHVSICADAARAGGRVLLDWIGRFQVKEKGPADLVTDADFASQEAVKRVLTAACPRYGFIGEETGLTRDNSLEYHWIVDPLDGTTNYVHQLPGWAVSVGLEQRGQIIAGAVYDPIADECFTGSADQGAFLNGKRIRTSSITQLPQALVAVSFAAKVHRESPEIQEFLKVVIEAQAVRRLGSAALNLCYVANGRFDAYWAGETKIWDVAAGILFVQEAGGKVSSLDGGPFSLERPRFLATGTTELHQAMLPLVRRPA